MGEVWHGEVEWAAYHRGIRVPTGSTVEPDLQIAWVQHPAPQQIQRLGAHFGAHR
jgi:hypothetical protein